MKVYLYANSNEISVEMDEREAEATYMQPCWGIPLGSQMTT